MLIFDTPQELKNHIGKELGVSNWLTIEQQRIDTFAAATGDDQWIHIDPKRVAGEFPGGKTIAHGYLTLSLIPVLSRDIYTVKNRKRGINYGLNRVRFTNMVPAGTRIRLRQRCLSVEDINPNGVRVTWENVIEVENEQRPACIAESIALIYS